MDYTFIDYGEGRRLEKFGDVILDRAFVEGEDIEKSLDVSEWKKSLAYFEREDPDNMGWKDFPEDFPKKWEMNLDFGLKCELRLASHNQIGIFPEQYKNWHWVREILSEKKKSELAEGKEVKPIKILNAFAYTGLANIYAASAGDHVSICHLDGSRPAINWAKKNAELSKIHKNQIRWIEDDVLTFLKREIKRGNKYDGFILDPPAFGRGKKGLWKIDQDLDELLYLVNELLTDDALFVVLSSHAEGLYSSELQERLEQTLSVENGVFDKLGLEIHLNRQDSMIMGSCARWKKPYCKK